MGDCVDVIDPVPVDETLSVEVGVLELDGVCELLGLVEGVPVGVCVVVIVGVLVGVCVEVGVIDEVTLEVGVLVLL